MTVTTIEDLRQIYKKRVPQMFYDYADSGSYTEGTYRANEDDLQRIQFRQRVAVDMTKPKSCDKNDWRRCDDARGACSCRVNRNAAC